MEKPADQVFDELLILRMKEGDKKAMHLFIKRWNSRVFQRICYLTNNVEASKDILQEAWSAIIKNISSLVEPSKYKSWVMTISSRKAYDWIKSRKNSSVIPLDNVNEIEISDESEELKNKDDLISIIRMTIRELDNDHRIILTMFYLEELSLNQITKQLNIPKGTAKSRLFYARELLKKQIKKELS